MKVQTYRDGGTRSFYDSSFDHFFKEENVEICQDNRIGSTLKGTWWKGYPKKGRPLTKEEEKYCVEEIIAYLGKEYSYAKYIYEDVKDSNPQYHFKDSFNKHFKLKSSSYISGNNTTIYNGKENYSIINENDICSLKNEKEVIFIGSLEECYDEYIDELVEIVKTKIDE